MTEKTNPQKGKVESKSEPKSAHAEREERILKFWEENDVFKLSLDKDSPKGKYIFYDGPPFATGTPHYGHILAGTIKDVIPRWKTMQGFSVPRRWGWDCHGLPVENLIEKELGLKSKKDIVDYGIENFNEAAKESVMRYADEWRRIVPRLGRFVDMENDYRTMDASYTETVWWTFKKLNEKGLIYEDFKSMYYCPRCETTLSNFEVAQGYKDITDISAYVRFKIPGQEKTFFLAWTTTPWTLPGNVALAVHPELEYVKVAIEGEVLILAKSRLSALKDKKYEIVETIKGEKLVGMSYEPVFHYYSNKKTKNFEKGWKVYGAEFVTAEDGTGIVHIAPAFGADDYDLLRKYSLPFVQHVGANGRFKPEVKDFNEMPVKPVDTAEDKNAHQSADVEVIKWLAHKGFLFEKEKIIHSYPHCWRCDTPLLNYATSSWFVRVTDLKDKLVKENEQISWVPPEVGSARFGNWLEGARDWAISRSRFWGAPIPVWKEVRKEKDNETNPNDSYHVIGSVEELRQYSHANNSYYVMRHGQAENNTKNILNGDPKSKMGLTKNGRETVEKSAESLKSSKIDLIIVSELARAAETAEIVRKTLDLKKTQVITDARLNEISFGEWEGFDNERFEKEYPIEKRFTSMPKGAETYADVKKRMGDFLYHMEEKYKGKTILVVSHSNPSMMLMSAAYGWDIGKSLEMEKKHYMQNGEVRKIDFVPLPHNRKYELDLHRPFIDEVVLKTKDGNQLMRVPDVFDCWYESGSMPYGKAHYPFAQIAKKNGDTSDRYCEDFEPEGGLFTKSRGFPADFIAEGLDQTRGWFYSMLVLGVALFGKSPYKKVIVNGLVLAEDGQKMSKRQKNYPDPMMIVDKYGADSLRFYLLSSPVVHGQDLCFSERGVDEVTKKIVNRILNVVSFYEMYATGPVKNRISANVLDRWIIARLNETNIEVTKSLEAGELDRAVRPFFDFTDDLSTWYLRRSRDRFKGDDAEDAQCALSTTRIVLEETSKLLAPFMPFLAEEIYSRSIKFKSEDNNVSGVKSVHLQSWPEAVRPDTHLLAQMKLIREIASKALEARMAAKINVRQPLSELKVRDNTVDGSSKDFNSLVFLIKEEVNVKNISFGAKIEPEVELNTVITPELKEEGALRELLRKIQDMRKENGLKVGESASFTATEDLKELVSKFEKEILKAASLSKISFGDKLEIR